MTTLTLDQAERQETTAPVSPSHLSQLPKFAAEGDFFQDLKGRVDRYFEENRIERRDSVRMYAKTAVVVAWCAASYGLLLAFAQTWWLAVPLAISLGLAVCAVAFNLQHDGGHQSYSRRRGVNKLMAMSLDVLGGSSYLWARKHNTIHHSYTNIVGHDDDIELGGLGRLSPHHRRLWFHRLQHVYLWFLYGVITVKWQFFDDFRDYVRGQSGGKPCPRPRGGELALFFGGKLIFYTLALAVPLMLHPVSTVLLLFAVVSFVQGVVLSVVFQLAHVVEEAEFPLPVNGSGRMDSAWAVHQIQTTVDFSRRSRLVSWYVGGLNFQVEHHLFPRICHVHYPALSKVVEETCRDHGVRYLEHKTLWSGIASHYRWLKRLAVAD